MTFVLEAGSLNHWTTKKKFIFNVKRPPTDPLIILFAGKQRLREIKQLGLVDAVAGRVFR